MFLLRACAAGTQVHYTPRAWKASGSPIPVGRGIGARPTHSRDAVVYGPVVRRGESFIIIIIIIIHARSFWLYNSKNKTTSTTHTHNNNTHTKKKQKMVIIKTE